NDRISMIHRYRIIRLWEQPFDELLASLPSGCLGLALFGWRPAEVPTATALERCAFTLRRALQGKPRPEAQRAALGLATVGATFVGPAEVTRLLSTMNLL